MDDDALLGAGLSCFIVSPIGNKLEPLSTPGRSRYEESIVMWEEVFEPASQHFGLAPVRADRITDTGEIPDQIFTYLRDADVVIADLSHANPNVMYELGLRHSRPNKITIQVGEYGFLPFDVTTIRTIQFNRTAAGLIGARDDIISSLRTALTGGGTPVRATSIFSSGDGIADIGKDVARSVAPEDSLDESSEPGIIDVLEEGEAALSHLSEVLVNAQEFIVSIGTLSSEFGDKVTISDGLGKGFAGRLLVAKEFAEVITPVADSLEASANDFYSDVVAFDVMTRYIIERFETGEEKLEDGREYFQQIIDLVDSAEGAQVGIMAIRDGGRALSKMSRVLDAAGKTVGRSGNRFLEGIGIMSKWKEPLKALSDQLDGQ